MNDKEQFLPAEVLEEISRIALSLGDAAGRALNLLRLARGMPAKVEEAINEVRELLRKVGGKEEISPAEVADVIDKFSSALKELVEGYERIRDEVKQKLPAVDLSGFEKTIEELKKIVDEVEQLKSKVPQQTPPAQAEEAKEAAPKEKVEGPTLESLTAAVNAFAELVAILNNLADKVPQQSNDSLAYWNFLKNVYHPQANKITALISTIEKTYPDLIFTADNAADILMQVYKRLNDDIGKWKEWVTQQTLVKANPKLIASITLPHLERIMQSISEGAVRRAGLLLQSAEKAMKEYTDILAGMIGTKTIQQEKTQEETQKEPEEKKKTSKILSWLEAIPQAVKILGQLAFQLISTGALKPQSINQQLEAARLQAGAKLLQEIKPLRGMPKPQRKVVRLSGLRLTSSDEGRKLTLKLLREVGKEAAEGGEVTPRLVYLDAFHEMIRVLHDFLWGMFHVGKEHKTLEEITEEDLGPLKTAGMNWRNKALALREVLSKYIKRYQRRPRKPIEEELEEIGNDLLQHLTEFVTASKELIRQYIEVKQQYKKMGEKGEEMLARLPNFEALLNAPDGIPLLQDLIPIISQWKQALKTSQQLLRALLPQGDQERQQWLIEEKHTL